jgi:hypothetical protein
MATAKPKVKRMMFGGAAKSGVGNAAAALRKLPMNPPPKKAPPPAFPAKSGVGNAAAALRKLPMNPPMPGKAGPKPLQAAKTGLGQAMNKPTMGLGAAMANKKLAGVGALAGRALGMGKKKGGAVKKATKK